MYSRTRIAGVKVDSLPNKAYHESNKWNVLCHMKKR